MGNSIVGTNTTTMRDHFWNVGANEDGRHRMIQSPAFTVAAAAADPLLGTGMDSVFYAKTVLNTVQWFRRNVVNIYQVTPALLTGTVTNVTSSYQTVVAVPANCYGEIFMYTTNGTADEARYQTMTGFFRSDGTYVNAWAIANKPQGSATVGNGLKFGNGNDADLLNIKVRVADAPSGATWTYIITYRAL